MQELEILRILNEYGIDMLESFREINSTNGEDYRLNIIVNKKYVLRINTSIINEVRLESISRLCERYRQIGILAPKLYKNKEQVYSKEIKDII